MNISKNIIIVILSIAVVVLAIMHFGPKPKDVCETDSTDKAACMEGGTHDPCICTNTLPPPEKCKSCGQDKANCNNGCTHDPCICKDTSGPTVVTNEHSSVEAPSVDRLKAQKIKTIAEVKGQGRFSKLCYKTSGKFYYVHELDAESRVLAHDVGADGIIEVEEERSFKTARETIDCDSIDVALSFDQIPLADIEGWAETAANAAGLAAEAFSLSNPWASAVAEGVEITAEAVKTVADTLQKIDGVSMREWFANHGLSIPRWLEKLAKKVADDEARKRMEQFRGNIQRLENSTYRLSYYQKGEGKPMFVSYRRVDGGILTKEEQDVLDSVNVFLDSKLVPDESLSVGEEWSVDAADIAQLVGTATGGRITGKLRMKRLQDLPGSFWEIKLQDERIRIQDEKGRPSGALVLDKDTGHGKYAPSSHSLMAMQISGSGKLDVESTRKFLLFKCVTRSEGECKFNSVYVAKPLE